VRQTPAGTVAELILRRGPGKLLDRLLAAARRRPGPSLEIAVRRAQRAHRRCADPILRCQDRVLSRGAAEGE
jgi:hypothetical protein